MLLPALREVFLFESVDPTCAARSTLVANPLAFPSCRFGGIDSHRNGHKIHRGCSPTRLRQEVACCATSRPSSLGSTVAGCTTYRAASQGRTLGLPRSRTWSSEWKCHGRGNPLHLSRCAALPSNSP